MGGHVLRHPKQGVKSAGLILVHFLTYLDLGFQTGKTVAQQLAQDRANIAFDLGG